MEERDQKSIDDLFHEVETHARPETGQFRTLYDKSLETVYILREGACWACPGYEGIAASLAPFGYKRGLEGATLILMEESDHKIWPPQEPTSDHVELCTPQLMHRRVEALKRDFGFKEVQYITKKRGEGK